MDGLNNPYLQMGLGILGSNAPGVPASQAIGQGGMLGLQNYQQMLIQQAAMQAAQQKLQREEEERKRLEAARQQVSQLYPQEAPLLEAYPSAATAIFQSKFPAPNKFGTTVQYVKDKTTGAVLPAQASQAGGVFILSPSGESIPFDSQKHELIKPYSFQDYGGGIAPAQPLTGQIGIGGRDAPMQQFQSADGGEFAAPAGILGPGEVLSPNSQYQPTPSVRAYGGIAKTPPPEQMPEFKAEVESKTTTAGEQAKYDFEKKAAKPKIRRAAESAFRRIGNVQRAIEQARANTSSWTTGLIGSATRNIPGTPAHNLERSLATIEANLGFDKLQDMRDNSPTGGALGQVSERELDLLQAAWASLAQSQDEQQFRSNLDAVQAQYEASWDAVEKAYQEDYGEPLFPNGRPKLGAAGPQQIGQGMSLQQRALQELQKRKGSQQ